MADSSRLARLGAFYLGLITVLLLFAAAVVVWLHADVPLRDQWRILLAYLATPGLAGTWAPQNGHVMFFPGLLYRADMAWFAGSGHLLLAVMHLLNGLVAALLAWVAWSAKASPTLRRTVAGFALFAMVWMGATLHLTWSQGIAHHMTVFAVLAAVVAVQRAGRASRWGAGWLLLSIGMGVVASFSFGNGLLVWPLVLAAGWLAGLRGRPLWWVGGVMVLAVGAYLLSVPGGGRPWVQATWKHFIDLAIIFLGAPVAHALDFVVPVTTRATVSVARWAGVVLALLGLLAAVRMAWARITAPGAVVALSAMAMVGGTALLVAWARVEQFGPAVGASQRYVVWGALYLAALAALLPYVMPSRWHGVTALLVMAVTVVMVPAHLKMGMASGVEAHRAKEAVLALAVGVRDDPAIHAISDSGRIDLVYQAAGPLKKRGLNPFNDPVMTLPGTPVDRHFKVTAADRCLGRMVAVTPTTAPGERGLRILGWAWDREANRPPRFVLTVNRHGTINGVARFSRLGQEVAPEGVAPSFGFDLARMVSNRLPGMLEIGHGWAGYARPDAKLLAMAVLADGTSICPLLGGRGLSGPR